MTRPDDKGKADRQQKRAVLRTVLLLAAIVLGIYLFFIGRAFMNYPGA
jgi:hypothetical protein